MSEWGDELDCHTCDEQLRKERGHDTEGTIPFYINGEQHFRCPLMLVTPLSWEYVKAFTFYEKNLLPGNLGWEQQPNKFIQAMMKLNNEFNKVKKEREEGLRKKHGSYRQPKTA